MATRTVEFPDRIVSDITIDSQYPGRQVHTSPYTGQQRIANLGDASLGRLIYDSDDGELV